MGYSPRDDKESDTTEQLHFSEPVHSTQRILNPLLVAGLV